MPISDAERAILVARNQWKPWCIRRTQLRETGNSTEQVAEILLKEFGVSGRGVKADAPAAPKPAGERKPRQPKINMSASYAISSEDRDILLTKMDGKQVDERTLLRWIFENLDVEDLKPTDAPSPGAWSFLCRIRDNPAMQVEFYTDLWPKLLPSKAQIEPPETMTDDGHCIDLIERISKGLGDAPVLQVCPEGDASEPGIPAQAPA